MYKNVGKVWWAPYSHIEDGVLIDVLRLLRWWLKEVQQLFSRFIYPLCCALPLSAHPSKIHAPVNYPARSKGTRLNFNLVSSAVWAVWSRQRPGFLLCNFSSRLRCAMHAYVNFFNARLLRRMLTIGLAQAVACAYAISFGQQEGNFLKLEASEMVDAMRERCPLNEGIAPKNTVLFNMNSDWFPEGMFGNSGLGNVLFMYAAMRGLSAYYNHPLSNATGGDCTRLHHADMVHGRGRAGLWADWLDATNSKAKSGSLGPCDHGNDFQYARFRPCVLQYRENAELRSFLQSWKFFCNVAGDIVKEFRFVYTTCLDGPGMVQAALTAAHISARSVTIGLHLRLGDYLCDEGAHYWIANKGFVQRALARLLKQIDHGPRIAMLVFCGGIQGFPEQLQLCSDLVPQIENVQTVMVDTATHSPLQDQAMLGACDHLIITSGSFPYFPGLVVAERGGVVVASKYPVLNAAAFSPADFWPPTFDLVEDDNSNNATVTEALKKQACAHLHS